MSETTLPTARWMPATTPPSDSLWRGAVLLDDGWVVSMASWEAPRGFWSHINGGRHLPNVTHWLLIGAHVAIKSTDAAYEARIDALTRALRDAISTYRTDGKEVIVTAERQEAWALVLMANGTYPEKE